ncbi:MAG: MFS transporter [bacterium]
MRYCWIMLFICFLAVFAFLSSLQAVPPLLPQIMQEYRLTHTIASTLILLVALPAVFTSLLGGVLVDRYGAKNLVSIGLALVCTGDLLSTYPALSELSLT